MLPTSIAQCCNTGWLRQAARESKSPLPPCKRNLPFFFFLLLLPPPKIGKKIPSPQNICKRSKKSLPAHSSFKMLSQSITNKKSDPSPTLPAAVNFTWADGNCASRCAWTTSFENCPKAIRKNFQVISPLIFHIYTIPCRTLSHY